MKINRIVLSLLLILGLVSTIPVIAQDELTPEVTETASPTIEPAPVETPAPEPEPTPQPNFDLIEFLAGAALGAVGTLTAVFGIVGRFKNDTALLNAIEGLTRSIPADTLDKLTDLGRTIRDAGEVLEKITDRLPNDAGS